MCNLKPYLLIWLPERPAAHSGISHTHVGHRIPYSLNWKKYVNYTILTLYDYLTQRQYWGNYLSWRYVKSGTLINDSIRKPIRERKRLKILTELPQLSYKKKSLRKNRQRWCSTAPHSDEHPHVPSPSRPCPSAGFSVLQLCYTTYIGHTIKGIRISPMPAEHHADEEPIHAHFFRTVFNTPKLRRRVHLPHWNLALPNKF